MGNSNNCSNGNVNGNGDIDCYANCDADCDCDGDDLIFSTGGNNLTHIFNCWQAALTVPTAFTLTRSGAT